MNATIDRYYSVMNNILERDSRVIGLVALSGVGISPKLFDKFPSRFVDVGIMEQAAVSMAAGMSIAGMIPVLFGQSTFIIERAYEQLKIDFGYQEVQGNFVVFGGSTESGVMGATHCCPAAVAISSMIPGMQIVVPGNADEFESIFLESYDNNSPTIFRISRYENSYRPEVSFGKATIIKRGTKATVIAIGPMLELAMRVFEDEDVTILYYTTIVPFDKESLVKNIVNDRILILEPSYKASFLHIISSFFSDKCIKMDFVGYPLEFISNHGFVIDNAPMYHLTADDVIEKYNNLLK